MHEKEKKPLKTSREEEEEKHNFSWAKRYLLLFFPLF